MRRFGRWGWSEIGRCPVSEVRLLMSTELIFIVVVLAIILAIAQNSSARREADRRRNERTDRAARPTSTGKVAGATPFDHLGFGTRTQLTRCPKCGKFPGLGSIVSTPSIIMPIQYPSASIHDSLTSLNQKRYCSKCKAPLWRVCPKCDGRRVITVPLEPGEERYCSYCGAELRQEKQIKCPECNGKGEVSTDHNVINCPNSFS